MGEKDLTQKILLNYKDVFADVCNALIFKGKFTILPEDLEDANPDIPHLHPDGKAHEVLRDVVKTYKPLNIKVAILGIENQTTVDAKMVFRDYRYRALDYCRQSETDDYIVPVITAVCFYDHTKHWTAGTSLKENLKIPKGLEDFVQDYKIQVIEVAWLSDEERAMLKSDFKLVADALHELRTTNKIHGSKQRVTHARAVMAMLLALVRHDNYQETDFYWINEEEEHTMDETWRQYEEKLRTEGYNKGKDDGYTLGKDDGKDEAISHIALKMLEHNMDSQLIMQMTSISQDELKALQAKVTPQP